MKAVILFILIKIVETNYGFHCYRSWMVIFINNKDNHEGVTFSKSRLLKEKQFEY